jgi:AcrR family transcriptional regulator
VPKLTEEAKQERRERILAGARRCFARHGYEGATVARLEEETGLSRGAIFNWYPSKEALFLALATRENTRMLELIVEQGFDGAIHAVAEEDADWLAVYLEFGRRLRASAELREQWLRLAPEELQERTKRWIAGAQEQGELRDDLAPDEIGKFLGVVFDGIVVQRALGFDAPPPALVVRLVGDALRGRAAGSGEGVTG